MSHTLEELELIYDGEIPAHLRTAARAAVSKPDDRLICERQLDVWSDRLIVARQILASLIETSPYSDKPRAIEIHNERIAQAQADVAEAERRVGLWMQACRDAGLYVEGLKGFAVAATRATGG